MNAAAGPRALRVLYRGPLGSCNYDCAYCPFAKHVSSREELNDDERGLARFLTWAREDHGRPLGVLFTPWGEALIRRWYREAMLELSHLPHVERVVAQTNLTGSLAWLDDANHERLALWVTFHPSQISIERFVERVRELDDMGVRYSVGIVGLKEHAELAAQLRESLRDEVYLWVNAYKSAGLGYYADAERAAFARIDPLFEVNNLRHPSRGALCRAGADAITVDGEGNARRCHFIDGPSGALGNLYQRSLDDLLAPSATACPNESCGCHIGYVHLERLDLYPAFEGGLLERIWAGWPRERPKSELPASARTDGQRPAATEGTWSPGAKAQPPPAAAGPAAGRLRVIR